MANWLQRVASRVTGLPTADTVRSLQSEVATLQARVRMRPASSGVPMTFGEFDYEYVEALRGDDRWLIYDKMESDPHIKAGLDAIVLPLVTAIWEVQPASDKAKDVEVAEFVAANLLRNGSDRYGREYFCESSWQAQRLPEILDMLKCGYALFAKSTKEVNGKIVYQRIQWLEPRSVDPRGWRLSEDDRFEGVERTYTTPNQNWKFMEALDAKQLALYVWDLKGARYEGRPKIRSLYGAFTRKDFISRQAVIWAQKVGAPMPIVHYPDAYPAEHIVKVQQAAMAARGQSPAEAFAMFPITADGRKVTFEFAGSDVGEVDRMRGLIDGENAEIAHGMGTKSRLLGETQTGSRAVGQTQSEDEDVYVQAVADAICEMEMNGVGNLPGLIEELVEWNFPSVKDCPRLIVSRIGPKEDYSTLDPLIKAVQAGLVPRTPELRKQVTEKFGIELPDDAYEIELEPVVPPGSAAAPQGADSAGDAEDGSTGQDEEDEDEETVSASLAVRKSIIDRLRPLLAPVPGGAAIGTGHRPPTMLEAQVTRIADVADVMDRGKADLHQDLRVIRDAMVSDLMARLRAGKVSTRNLDGLRRSKFRGQSKAERTLLETLTRIGNTAAEQASDDMDRAEGRNRAR